RILLYYPRGISSPFDLKNEIMLLAPHHPRKPPRMPIPIPKIAYPHSLFFPPKAPPKSINAHIINQNPIPSNTILIAHLPMSAIVLSILNLSFVFLLFIHLIYQILIDRFHLNHNLGFPNLFLLAPVTFCVSGHLPQVHYVSLQNS